MTIAEAAQKVLKNAGHPMKIDDIYAEIVKQGLYSFGAKDPKAVLSKAIRKKSTANSNAKDVIFKFISQDTYEVC